MPTFLSHPDAGQPAVSPDSGTSAGPEIDSAGATWVDLLPWLRGYRFGPPILDPNYSPPNAWIELRPRDGLSTREADIVHRSIATRFVDDLPQQPLGSAYPAVPSRLTPAELCLQMRTTKILNAHGIDTVRDLLRHNVESILELNGAGRATAVDIVASLIRTSRNRRAVHTDAFAESSSALDEVESFVASCSERDLAVLRSRVFAAIPSTLDTVGTEIGLSRERVGQIENTIRARLTSELAPRPHLSELADQLDRIADPIASLARASQRTPDIDTFVPSLGLPLRTVLSALDSRFTVEDGWVSKDNAHAARTRFTAVADSHSTAEGLISVHTMADRLNMPAPELIRYANTIGYRTVDGHLVLRSLPVPGHVAAVLALSGTAMTVGDLLATFEQTRSESAVRNALVNDSRFVKTDKTTWGLRRWGLTPYVPIHRQIAKLVDARGSIGIDRLITEITAGYYVAEFSIRTYAATGDFVTTGDIVTRRTKKYTPRKTPAKTRHLYRDEGMVRWRTTVAPIHEKGSAFNLPSALAALLNVGPGSPREFHSRLGDQSVLWVSVQARSGTIKRFVDDLELCAGEDIFLEFGDDGRFDVVRIPATDSNPIRASVQAVGRSLGSRTPSATAALATIADALWQPDATAAGIVDVLTTRREDDLAALVKSWAF